MWTTLRASTSRLTAPVASVRQLSTTVARSATVGKRDLGPNKFARTPAALLDLMGRDAPKRLGEQAGSWEQLTELYKAGTEPLREAGVGVKDRKYYMRCLSRFAIGERPWLWVRKVRPPKKFRRLGPKVQNGVRVFTKDGQKRLIKTG